MNTAIAQAYFASHDKGVNTIISATGTENGAPALAIACNYFGLKCKIFMTRSSYEHKVYGRYIMEILGAEVISSPRRNDPAGKKIVAQNPDSPAAWALP